MELTARQKLTLENLKGIGITDPLKIIEFCIIKLNKPRKNGIRDKKRKALGLPKLTRSATRKHSRKHYQGIIDYLVQA